MKFTLKIESDGAALTGDSVDGELTDILEDVIADISDGGRTSGRIIDSNGNHVGD